MTLTSTFFKSARRFACALVVLQQAAAAQTSPSRADSLRRDSLAKITNADSLAARLARAEAAIALLREQLATESSTQVRLRSRLRMDLHARLLTNAFLTTNPASNSEVPVFAKAFGAADDYGGSAGGRAAGITVRQTTMGGSVGVDSVLGGSFSADFELDFFAGALGDSPPLFPPPRLRTARGFMRWAHTELMVGSDTPLISDLDPVSIAGIAIPDFSTAGNLWNWLPQVRVTRDLGVLRRSEHALHVAVQGAVINPYSGDRHPLEADGIDAGNRAGRPSLEGRLRLQWGVEHDATTSQRIGDRGGEIGFGAHQGWLRSSGDTLTKSWAVSTDWRVGLSHGFELRGEAYRGRLLRGLGGGGIGQNFAPSTNASITLGEPLTDIAGWLQLNAQVNPSIIAGAGCGTDRVENGMPARQRNSVCASHVSWRPASPLLVDLEYRGIATRGPTGRLRTSHFNLSFGIEL